jgi:hypothetical protein
MVSHCLPSPEHLDANILAALDCSLPGNAWLGNRTPRALVHCCGRLRRLPGWLSRAPRSSFGCDGQLCLAPLGPSELPLAATSSRVRRLPPRRRRQRVHCEEVARKQAALQCDEGDLSEMRTEVPSPWHTPHRGGWCMPGSITIRVSALRYSARLAMVLRSTSLPASEEGGFTLPSRRAPVFLDRCSRALHGNDRIPPRGFAPSTSPSMTPSVARCSAIRFFHGFDSPPRPVPAIGCCSLEHHRIPLRFSWSLSPKRETHAAPASGWRTSLLPTHRGE